MCKSTSSKILFFFLFISTISFSQTFQNNLALERPTSQSSTGWGGDSWKAVDGNRSGYFDNGNLPANSVTHTATPYVQGSTEWWRVDLGKNYDISAIRIFNRANESGRLRGAIVYVGLLTVKILLIL